MSKNIKEDNIIADRKEGLDGSPLAPIDKSNGVQKFVGLNRKLLLLIFPLLVAGFVFVILATNIQLRNSLRSQLQTERSVTAQGIEEQIEGFFTDKINQIKVASLSSLVEQALIERNNSYVGSFEEIIAGVEELDKKWREETNDPENSSFIQDIISSEAAVNITASELHTFLSVFPEHSEVFITDVYGATLGSTAELSDYYQADEGWWQAAWNDGQGAVFVSQPEFDASAGINALLISLPILNSNNEIIGVIRSTLNVDAVFDIVAELNFGDTGHAILLNQDTQVIADPKQDAELSSKDLPPELLQQFLSEDQGAVVFRDEQGGESFFNFTSLNLTSDHHQNNATNDFSALISEGINNLSWTIVMRQKSSEAFSVVRNITSWSVTLGLITIALILLFTAIFTRKLISPLIKLTGVAQKISQGNLSETTDVVTNDEIGVLAGAFNDAIINLRTAIQEIEQRTQAAETNSSDLQKNIMGFLDVMIEVSEGDLTKRGAVTEDALGNVVDATNLMVEEIGILLGDVQNTAMDVGKGANDMISTSALIAKSNETRVDTANRLAEGLKIIATSMQTVSKNVGESSQNSQEYFACRRTRWSSGKKLPRRYEQHSPTGRYYCYADGRVECTF